MSLLSDAIKDIMPSKDDKLEKQKAKLQAEMDKLNAEMEKAKPKAVKEPPIITPKISPIPTVAPINNQSELPDPPKQEITTGDLLVANYNTNQLILQSINELNEAMVIIIKLLKK